MKFIILQKSEYGTYFIHNQKITKEEDADILCDALNKIDDGCSYTVIQIPYKTLNMGTKLN